MALLSGRFSGFHCIRQSLHSKLNGKMAQEITKAISPAIERGLYICCDTKQRSHIYGIKTALPLWTITVITGYLLQFQLLQWYIIIFYKYCTFHKGRKKGTDKWAPSLNLDKWENKDIGRNMSSLLVSPMWLFTSQFKRDHFKRNTLLNMYSYLQTISYGQKMLAKLLTNSYDI